MADGRRGCTTATMSSRCTHVDPMVTPASEARSPAKALGPLQAPLLAVVQGDQQPRRPAPPPAEALRAAASTAAAPPPLSAAASNQPSR